jgi:5,10-methylene-tetrahydrofolate dehydrogenase/methenyl tetrahydrofolate cyclohydrolase
MHTSVCACLQGCIELLKRSGVEMKGKTAAVVGRSNIVGLPVALLLQNEDATVTMVHSRTPNAGEQWWWTTVATLPSCIASCFLCCSGSGHPLVTMLTSPNVMLLDRQCCIAATCSFIATRSRHHALHCIVSCAALCCAEEVVRQADIVIAACGKAEMVKGSWLKPGAVVVDVGINAVDDPAAKRGYRLVGDVAYGEAAEVASQITPVPGGVGPMTIAMLLQNTLEGYKRRAGAA